MKTQPVGNLGCFLVIAAAIILPTTAQAYIDPGAGSLLLQFLLGGLAGAFVIGRLFWRSIVATVTRPFAKFRRASASAQKEIEASELPHADLKD